ncbi:MptD family putative ECF transporter S component [Ruminococcus sp. OA3]|uniref:MptD family putative ECF transporter S component n=1 Tax=Ruminococcus sp. OA3 TaxID=2914164 RepID=UPI001F064C75|nr:MptD family putative ECF transporter S component [Ruminococcus sp. OA3]MCH1983134.1 MptD family putative ECF transporter S component [Ruminococcus sp. OA3]
MSETRNGRLLKGKDLITIGIFSAIYFVINFAFMLLGGLHPMLWILMPGLIALFSGIPFMLMCTKVQKPGAVLLMGVITGLIYFVTGQFTVLILITFVIGCGLGECLRGLSNFKSFRGNMLAFVGFSLGMTGSPLPIWLMRDSFLEQIAEQGMPADYIGSLEKASSPAMLIVLFGAPVAGALIGAVLARGMFKKHFTRAGVV